MSLPARRRQVAYGRERGLSVRRACTPFSVARSALRYQGRKTVKDAGVIERMQELSAQYPRYGYRRIRIFLGRDGHRMSVGRAYRLWRAAGLQLPRKRPRKRVAAARPRPQAPSGPNQVWSCIARPFGFLRWMWLGCQAERQRREVGVIWCYAIHQNYRDRPSND